MRQLPVYFFSNCPFLQHDRHGVDGLRQRRDENIDRSAIAGSRRGNVDLVARDRRVVLARVRSSAPWPISKKVSAAVLASVTRPCPSTVISGWASALSTLAGSDRALWNAAVTPRPPASRRRRPGRAASARIRDRRSSPVRAGATPARRQPPRRRRGACAHGGGPRA